MGEHPVAAFPTRFPTDAVAKLAQIAMAGRLTPDIAEPIYDVSGYILGLAFGSSEPAPAPAPPLAATPESLAIAAEIERAVEEYVAASGRIVGAVGDEPKALPWGVILAIALKVFEIIRNRKAA